jgi:cyclopropane fatty-acyl-phospholipid synthase-like methyltransferase
MVGPPYLWRMKRNFQINFLKEMDLRPNHYLLDIGCGTLRGGIPIIDYLDVGHYYGIEVREEVLIEGHLELKEAGLEWKEPALLLTPDITNFLIDQKFDFIWAFSVLPHMSDDILRDNLKFVREHISNDGVFYANVNIDEREEKSWKGFPIVARTFEFYTQVFYENGLHISKVGLLRDLGHKSRQRLPDSQTMLKITKT